LIVKVRDELPSVARAMTRNAQDTGGRNLNALNQQFGVSTVEPVFGNQAGGRALSESSPLSKVMLLNLGRNVDERTALRAYASLEEVEYAELNYIYHIFSLPNDPFISSQYGLYSDSSNGIDALGAWSIEPGNSSIMIAVIDTGVDYRHEDLSGKVVKGYDFVNEDYDPMDDNGHGTHVAGVAGGIADNGRGIAGVCRECSILAVKVVTADGSGANSWIANGIANAVNLGARVLNLSLGGLDNSNTIRMAVE
jgi:thermitase